MSDEIALVPMTRERMHAYFQRFVTDADLFMDASQCRPYRYDAARVDAFFDRRAARKDAVWFAVTLDGAVIGDAGLKHIDADRRQCELSIHLVNDPLSEQRQFIAPLMNEYISPIFSDLLDKAPWYAGIAIGTLIAALLLLTWLIVKLRRTLKRKNK